MVQDRLKLIHELLQQAGKIDFAVLQRDGGQAVPRDFQKLVDQVLQPFRLSQGDGEILFPQFLGELLFIPQQVQVADGGGQGRFQVVSQVHHQIVFLLLGQEHVTFLPVNGVLRQIHFALNGEQLRGQGNFSRHVLEQSVHPLADTLKIPGQPAEITVKQTGEHQQEGQQDDGIHVTAEGTLIESEGGIIVHTQGGLKQGYHPVGKAAPQQDGVSEINHSGGGSQHGYGTEEYLPAKLAEVILIFQWCSQPPISF